MTVACRTVVELETEVVRFWIYFEGRANRISCQTEHGVRKTEKSADDPEQLEGWGCQLRRGGLLEGPFWGKGQASWLGTLNIQTEMSGCNCIYWLGIQEEGRG